MDIVRVHSCVAVNKQIRGNANDSVSTGVDNLRKKYREKKQKMSYLALALAERSLVRLFDDSLDTKLLCGQCSCLS